MRTPRSHRQGQSIAKTATKDRCHLDHHILEQRPHNRCHIDRFSWNSSIDSKCRFHSRTHSNNNNYHLHFQLLHIQEERRFHRQQFQ